MRTFGLSVRQRMTDNDIVITSKKHYCVRNQTFMQVGCSSSRHCMAMLNKMDRQLFKTENNAVHTVFIQLTILQLAYKYREKRLETLKIKLS